MGSTVGSIHLPPGHSPTGPAALGSSKESGELGKRTDQFDIRGRDHLDSEMLPTGFKDTPLTTAVAKENSSTPMLEGEFENMVLNGIC